MWRVTLRGLPAHKLRLALTALAVVLGVGFVAGTYVLTDTIDRTFVDLFRQTTKGIDVAVRSKDTFTGQAGEQRAPLPAALRERIAAVEGVRAAEGGVVGYAQFVGKNGKAVTTGGAPTIGISVSTTPQLQAAATVRSGRLPTGPGEVAVDARTARTHGFRVGDQVRILFQGAPGRFTVSGIERDMLLSLARTADSRQRSALAYRSELRVWTTDDPYRDDGIPLDAVGPWSRDGALPFRDFALDREIPGRDVRSFEPEPTVAMLSVIGHDTPADWLRAGQALQRVLLEATRLGLSTSLFTQPLEQPDLRELLADPTGRTTL